MTAEASTGGEWRRGWRLVIAAAMGTGMASTQAVTLGTFVHPLQDAFGWGRAEITSGLAIGSMGTILLTPLLGRIVDRFGARRVVLIGIWLYALGVAGLGRAGPDIASWYAAWAMLALLCMGMSPVAWTLAIASRFERGRGFALAVTLGGLNVASATLPFVAVQLIETIGWRMTYVALGAMPLLLVLPPALAWFHDASDLRRKARAQAGAADDPHADPAPATTGYRLSEAIGTTRFWRMIVCLMLVGGSVSALNIHFQPMLADAGMSASQAALIAGLLGPVSFVGRLATGYLLDRVPAPLVAGPAFALPIISCFILRDFDGSMGAAIAVAALNGMTIGAEIDLIAFLASRYFGMRQFGLIYGICFSSFTILYGVMPAIAGRIYDSTGSYDGVLIVLGLMLAASATLAATLGRYPTFDRAGPAPRRTPAVTT